MNYRLFLKDNTGDWDTGVEQKVFDNLQMIAEYVFNNIGKTTVYVIIPYQSENDLTDEAFSLAIETIKSANRILG